MNPLPLAFYWVFYILGPLYARTNLEYTVAHWCIYKYVLLYTNSQN